MKIFIETYGCTANLADSEAIAGIIAKKHSIVEEKNEADLIILNICTVKGNTVALKALRNAMKTGKRIIISGCISEDIKAHIKIMGDFSLVGTHNIPRINEAVDECLKGNTIEILGKTGANKLGLPRIRKNKIIAIIPISSGCNGSCTYCSVKLIKGSICSYPMNDIIQTARDAVNEGCRELWITSQDNSAYMLDKEKKTRLPELLTKICSIKGEFFVRVGMMNPNNILPVLAELIKAYKHRKVFKFLHLPVQSGSNKVLYAMNRKYCIADFNKIIRRFRKEIPQITIATDIIISYPTESEADFKDSLLLIKWLKPDISNISRFQAREGTMASRLKQLPGSIAKERSRKLLHEYNRISLAKNNLWIGWHGKVLVDEIGKNNTMIARNFCYKQVVLKKGSIGTFINVKIRDAGLHDLKA